MVPKETTVKTRTKNLESGVALFFSIFALLLLTAIAAALIFMSSTETSINSNYRQEQIAYFAAKAGTEEARARMMLADPNSLNVVGDPNHPLLDPNQVTAPSATNYMIDYIVNPGNGPAVKPWDSTNAWADDEICHDGYGTGFGTAVAPDIRCTPVTLGATSYVSYNSALPFNGTAGALAFKWVRIAPKLNSSITYLTGTGSTASVSTYYVNSAKTASNVICWDGQEEVVLNSPTYTQCKQMISANQAPMTNVYLVTALGVSPSGARKVAQAEVALQPTPPFPYGMYATSNACPAINFNGNNPSTDSYTTAGGQTYSSSKTNTGGDIGSNGGVDIGNGNIGGVVGVLAAPPAGTGCATPLAEGPNGSTASGSSPSCPSGNSTACYLTAPFTFPTPPAPNPLPPNTAYTPSSCGGKGKTGACMVPGTYGNITLNGGLTLAPGVYNINSLQMQGNASIIVNPPGAVTLNIGGCGDATCSAANALPNPLAIAGNGITDDTIPNDFIINYSGSQTVTIAGNGSVTAILNVPNAKITQQGNGNWYGSILGSTISIGGNDFFHYDRNAALAPANNGYYQLVSYREVPY